MLENTAPVQLFTMAVLSKTFTFYSKIFKFRQEVCYCRTAEQARPETFRWPERQTGLLMIFETASAVWWMRGGGSVRVRACACLSWPLRSFHARTPKRTRGLAQRSGPRPLDLRLIFGPHPHNVRVMPHAQTGGVPRQHPPRAQLPRKLRMQHKSHAICIREQRRSSAHTKSKTKCRAIPCSNHLCLHATKKRTATSKTIGRTVDCKYAAARFA